MMQENIILRIMTREGTKFSTAPSGRCSREWNVVVCWDRHVQQALNIESADVMLGCAAQSQIGQDAANQSAEFETMTGTAAREHNMREFRVLINHEILIGRYCVQA